MKEKQVLMSESIYRTVPRYQYKMSHQYVQLTDERKVLHCMAQQQCQIPIT